VAGGGSPRGGAHEGVGDAMAGIAQNSSRCPVARGGAPLGGDLHADNGGGSGGSRQSGVGGGLGAEERRCAEQRAMSVSRAGSASLGDVRIRPTARA
jgi:hypothetical protein